MRHGFTLYLYPDTKSYHWCEVLDELEGFAKEFSSLERYKSVPELHKIALEMFKTGIFFDTVEWENPAVFVMDAVALETLDDSGRTEIRMVKSWGNGGKTGTQVKGKLISMLKTFGKLLENGDIKPQMGDITSQDMDELIAHIRSEELHDRGCYYYGETLLEMTAKRKKETLLPMQIWIDNSKAYKNSGHTKRIGFQLDRSDWLESEFVGSMDLEGKLLAEKTNTANLKEGDLTQLRNFIRNNKFALEQLADANLALYDIWDSIIKGGDVASDKEMEELNEKVAAFVAARVARGCGA